MVRQRLSKKAKGGGAVSPDDCNSVASLEKAKGAVLDSSVAAHNERQTGRTPGGKAFAVPRTRDMVHSLFSPLMRKTTFDVITLATLSMHLLTALALPLGARRIVLMTSFAFWRLCYNGGLGWILNWQSNRHGLVALFKRRGWLDPQRGGWVYTWLKSELESKMGEDYSFTDVPIEFNVWLLYRQLVDLILLNDFTAYFMLCNCYIGSANDPEPLHAFLRVAGGVALLVFNLWVKVDAHRVVKDYAWYWGDFFFLIEQSLTFDGVFEMAPHPMYSIGYAGYYGGSLITGSYTIFYVSLAAHMLQFLFLSFVENPHIEKTYERPPLAVQVIKRSRNRRMSATLPGTAEDAKETAGIGISNTVTDKASIRERPASLWHPDLIVFKNFDLFRASDILIVLLLFYSVGVPLCFMWVAGHNQFVFLYSVVQCIGWILFRTLVLGFLLKRQSSNQLITRWYIKHGGNSEEAFSSWRAVYNTTTIMTYGAFGLVALTAYSWGGADYGTLFLAHTLGLLLIAFHVWSSLSVYETLGDFGWFYGDFFARDSSILSLAPPDIKLYYTGIYRYLNNPDKVIGQAAFYGLALISRSWAVFALALLLQICNFLFSSYVETPHMEKIYGAQVHRDSGIVRTVKNAVNKGVGQTVFVDDARSSTIDASNVPNSLHESLSMANILASTTRPVKDMFLETRDLLSTTTARIAEKTLPSELSRLEHIGAYALRPLPGAAWRVSAQRAEDKGVRGTYQLGEPIHVVWQVPTGHSRRDWIGIYPVTANFSNQITTVSSRGCYVYVRPDENLLAEMVIGDSVFASAATGTTNIKTVAAQTKSPTIVPALQGEALFSGAALPFKVGTYEMRLHHGGTHAVLAQSKPFEITVCDTKDIVRLLGKEGNGCSNATGRANNEKSPEPLDSLAQALLVVANKSFAVTDSHPSPSPERVQDTAVPSAILSDDGVSVHTQVVEPLESVHDPFSVDEILDDKLAKRLGYAIKVYFGVEFASDVLVHAAKHGATVYDVAKRILEAQQALSTYSSIHIKA
ncbi:phosphatidylethanolamine N-methyltransferase [Coemansia sp. RSA 1365]|nr:phosphatidylethanolamine N-methyltransferase [Coemansia sp. RSA 1365]